jgi:hypothetical protein
MQKIIFGLIALVLVGVGGFYAYKNNVFGNYAGGDDEGVVCTMEAKLCPDGVTYVGRSGPKCEFAACPSVEATSTTTTLDTQINKKVTAYNFSITPLEVVEDSRCPTDVQCIQAGTVRLKATLSGDLGAYTATLELNKPLINEEVSITLKSVTPAPLSTHKITPGEYRFTLEVKKIN